MASVSLIYSSGEYLIASQLPQGRRITARVQAVSVETVGQGQEQTRKLALELVALDGRAWPRKILLNKTNASVIATAFGDDTDGWAGHAIEIWQEPVSFRGRDVAGVRVAAVQERSPALQPQTTRGNGNGSSGLQIPEPSLADALEDEVPF